MAYSPRFESGKILPVAGKTQGWKLNVGNGERKYRQRIDLKGKYDQEPQVFVGLSMEDILGGFDHRIKATAENIDSKGFDICVSTWKDSGVWSAGISWIAFDSQFSEKLDDKGNQREAFIFTGVERFSEGNKSYKLGSGNGSRNQATKVVFPEKMKSVPNVFFAFSSFEVDHKDDFRLSSKLNNVSKEGFELNVSTWQKTKVRNCSVSWISIDGDWNEKYDNIVQLSCCKEPQMFKKDMPGYTLVAGEGSRNISRRLDFLSKFGEKPSVITCFSHIDVLKNNEKEEETDHRLSVLGDNINASGFDMKLSTWQDTLIWSAGASWLAFGRSNKPVPAAAAEAQKEEGKKEEEAKEPPAKKAKPAEDEEDEEKECKICMEEEINTVFIPCGHLAACEKCAQLLSKGKVKKCPICKTDIQHVVKTFKA
eukprot:TRINITY_DN6051_c0_g1_i1.p1 TRINITY_DN6051_c0_g1~~TRINITY_DN6051_c0_g1_i1.p1  ORF type:complete len:424 (-),score=152.64 TRINITY_DN6051_c0_g1_i1:122-1393(-)